MDRARSSLAAFLGAVGLVAAACGSSDGTRAGEDAALPYAGVPGATLLVSTGASGSWLQTKRLDGTRTRDVTRRVSRYEARIDEEASFSPDGTKVTFVRRSKRDRFAVMVAGRDGKGIRRILTLAQANRLAPGADWLRAPLFADDGRAVVVEARHFCSTEAILSVGLDDDRPVAVWRRPKGELVSVEPTAVLPDGTAVAVRSENDGDCYYGHTGPDRLVLLRAGAAPRPLGPPSSAVGAVVVARDRQRVLWVAGCFDVCQVWSAYLETGAARRLTTFGARNQPLDGYDSVAIGLLGDDVVVYGRGRSVYARSLSRSGTPERVVRFSCPRKKGCHLSEIGSIRTSPDGAWLIVDVADYGSDVWVKGSPEPIFERFAVESDSGRTVRLPVLEFSDLRFD